MKLKATTNVRQYIRTVSANNKRRIQKATVIANQRAAKEILRNMDAVPTFDMGETIGMDDGSGDPQADE